MNLENARQMAQGSKTVKASRTCIKGNYAIVYFQDTNIGGTAFYRKAGGRWSFVTGGGGMMDASSLVAHNVPAKLAEDLVKLCMESRRPG